MQYYSLCFQQTMEAGGWEKLIPEGKKAYLVDGWWCSFPISLYKGQSS